VFYVNVPFGVASLMLFALYLHERVPQKKRCVDYVGTGFLMVGITVLLVGLLEAGGEPGTGLVPGWVMIALAGGLLSLFVWQQSRAAEPLLPMGLFRGRVFSVSNGAGFLAGATLLGVSSYVPPFVQGVMGGTAMSAGAALAPLSIGWPVASVLSGRLFLKHGYRPAVVLGTGLILAGALMLATAGTDGSLWWIMASMLVMGLGMGFAMTSFLVAVQSSVGWGERGIATASVSFFRSIGGAVGVAALGGMMNGELMRGLAGIDSGSLDGLGGDAGVKAASVVLDPVARAAMAPEALEAVRGALAGALGSVYWAIGGIALGAVVLSAMFPARWGQAREDTETPAATAGKESERDGQDS
jgi:hypothetical protein